MKKYIEKIEKIKAVFKEELNINLYEEQISASLELVKGNFIEVKTGEGKSIINVITAYLLKETHEKLYIVSVNDYLSERDFLKFKTIYERLELKVSLNQEQNKKEVYSSDVIYTSSYRLIFDYLKYKTGISDIEVFLDGAIIDEADFVLVDNATSDFTISDEAFIDETPSDLYLLAEGLFKIMDIGVIKNNYVGYIKNNYDAIVDEFRSTTYITEYGIKKIEKALMIDDLLNVQGLYETINNTIKANCLYKKDIDYIVQDNKIILVSRSNGRLMKNSRLDNGLHLAIEIKEKVEITYWTKSNIQMSYQIFYNKFKNIYGLSGTLKNSKEELKTIYDKNIKYIKRHFKNKRQDKKDIIFKNNKDKKDWLIKYIKDIENPILVVAQNDKEAKEIYSCLNLGNKKIQFLNSYNYELEEKEIIKRCGDINTVTISTFLSARGVDIKINKNVDEIGGLEVISLTRYSNSRIDEQVRGRSARQGQRGSSQFLISLEDNIFNHLFIEDRESYGKLNDELFKSSKIQRKLSQLIDKCQLKFSSNLSFMRKENYLLEQIFTLQQQSIEKELINNVDVVNQALRDFIKTELDYIKTNNVKCSFLGEEIKEDTDIEKIFKNIMEEIFKALSLDSKYINQILKRIVTASIFEGFQNYKEQSLEYIRLLNINLPIHAYNFVNFNDNLFKTFKKQVYYTMINYLINMEVVRK